MPSSCQTVFNSLSKADRMKLKSAALAKTVSAFVRDDTKKHPIRFPFYAAYLTVIVTPLPFPLASTILLGTTALWARHSKTNYARNLHSRIRESFNACSLLHAHKDYMSIPEKADIAYKINNRALLWHTTKETAKHSWQAGLHAVEAVKNHPVFKKMF